MINRLYIRDFAIINELNLELKPGLTVITGETGSGKTILLQALSLALGSKGNKNLVKSGKKKTIVEAEVQGKNYRRIFSEKGRSRSYIEHEPVKDIDFRTQTKYLADFHGQHEQQLIMGRENHIDYLDRFCRLEKKVQKCIELYQSLQSSKTKLKQMLENKSVIGDRRELLEFQINEIEQVSPCKNEDYELMRDFRFYKHIDEMVESISNITGDFTESDHSIQHRISTDLIELEKLSSYDEKLNQHIDEIKSVLFTIQETSVSLTEYSDGLNPDTEKLNTIELRIKEIENLKRKYGGSIESVKNYHEEIRCELEEISQFSSDADELYNQIEQLEEHFKSSAQQLHKIRISKVEILSKKVQREMERLNMPSAIFEIKITQLSDNYSFVHLDEQQVKIHSKGFDQVEFFLSANPGEEVKPLTEIASGGEISRIMLAIKSVFNKIDPVDTLVFDEIDTGISGVTAEKVSESLKNISTNKQVMCISHLPQIARAADNHLHVSKTIVDDTTIISVNYLDKKDQNSVIDYLAGTRKYLDLNFQKSKSAFSVLNG